MAALLIVIALSGGFVMWMIGSRKQNAKRIQRGFERAERMNGTRDIMTDAQYLAQLKTQARQMRCGEMARPGVRSCKRAAGRPCVRGCKGRISIDTRWLG